jgi:hypothetical protein
MKNIIIVAILLFSCILTSCTQEAEKSEREKRKGYAELKVYHCYYDNDGKIDMEDKTLIQHDTYDGEGNVVARVIIEEIDDEICKYGNEFNKYNENNMLVESTYFNSDGEKYKYTIIKYNKNNIITEKTIEYYRYYSNVDKTIYKYTYRYDNNGNEISYTEYDSTTWKKDNILKKEVSYSNQYNNKNQLIQKKAIAKRYYENKLSNVENLTFNYKYNDKGLIIESPTSVVPEYTIFSEYCWRLNWVSSESDVVNNKYKYNNKDLIIEQEEITKYGIWWLVKYNYNDKNLITEITFFRKVDDPFRTFIYEYN